MNVVERFSSIAELWPDRIATCHRQDGQWRQTSYDELLNSSGRLAAALVAAGVQPGDAVLVPARRHKDLLVHMLAILEAGAHYVVVDDNYPLPRQELIQQTAKARFGLREAGDASLNGLDVQWLEAEERRFRRTRRVAGAWSRRRRPMSCSPPGRPARRRASSFPIGRSSGWWSTPISSAFPKTMSFSFIPP